MPLPSDEQHLHTTFRGDGLSGAELIRYCLAQMPGAPGVYRMLDEKGNALYIGKAKHLRNRISSYVSATGLSTRIMRMVSQTAAMEIITTKNEAEALLLEANMVKRLMPRYNILLKDDKSFPFIFLSGDHVFPQILKHRGTQTRKGDYFGPFASVGAVNNTLSTLQKAFLLRPCSDNIFKNRSRPCLQYQIKRCSAPCVDYISKEAYARMVGDAKAFLTGKSRDIQQRLEDEMQKASSELHYEKAVELRDRIHALTQIQQEQGLYATSISDADVIALSRDGDQSCIQVFFFRGGQNFGNKSFFPSHAADSTDNDIMAAFISQFYQSHIPPRLLLLSHSPADAELLADALSLTTPYRVEIAVPERGGKKEAVAQAVENAERSLMQRLSDRTTQIALLRGVAERLGLDEAPRRIEVYDNSHIMGSNTVGGMIVAGPEGFMPKAYRSFNRKDMTLVPGDDYGMMRHVLTRRLSALLKGGEEAEKQWPDLLLIDGGGGHLSAVQDVFADLGITIPCVAIAKGVERNAGREWFFMPDKEPFQLPPQDPVLHYLQRLRDEAHRFAIGMHRKKRSKSMTQSSLDTIPGIGTMRKKALLHHFGSGKAVETATLHELEKVEGISSKTAKIIYEHFRG